MKNLTSKPRWAGLCALVLAFTALFGQAALSAEPAKMPTTERVDLIGIKPVVAKPEMPGVVFVHDKHSMAVGAEGKNCSTCHDPVLEGARKGQLSYVFKGTENKTGTELKNAFHAKCIGCHTDTGRAGKPTGPLDADCRGCHSTRPELTNAWKDIGFDKLVHYKHVSSAAIAPVGDPQKNCGACHHVYDATAKKQVWVKDKEDSCRACHLMPQERADALAKNPNADADGGIKLKDMSDFRVAGHTACVGCHQEIAAKKQPNVKVGPVDCAGCHSASAQAKLTEGMADTKTAQSIPRLMRSQPDAVLLLPQPDKEKAGAIKGTMKPVAFNHEFHEGVTPDCRSCHHKKIESCRSCHTLEGSPKGGGIGLAAAMHKKESTRACVGCHTVEKQKPSCAGCHNTLPKGTPPNSCAGCHAAPVGVTASDAEDGSLLKLSKDAVTALAKATVDARKDHKTEVFAQTEIPDQVTIGILGNEYEPVVLPHRKIVKTLLDRQNENRLAAVFHSDKASLCQGCHHNSPASKTPPKCVSCHTVDGQSAGTGRPALKAAYHQQCMNCHAVMQQKPAATDCTEGCHKPRRK